ncbi:MAG TPA: class I SAM-dependent methyltransferase [Terracidiphilus sp.]|nr:class I SAM-dependent methyltransferase [Terracidiphilus sp.]
MLLPNPAERFTGRVESYRVGRPRYPAEIVELLRRECRLREGAAVVDVAAGTGLLAEVFLAAGFVVTAVEPNAEMRAACSELSRSFPRIRCIDGRAEDTGLAEGSADLVTVGQAMHWFDLERTRAEFARILKRGGCCAVIYNNRRMIGDAFATAYERFLLEFSVDYEPVKKQHVGKKRLEHFFAPAKMNCAVFANSQALTRERFEGRVFSSSYIPRPGHERFGAMQAEMQKLFDTYESGGAVTIEYDCVVCYGRLTE